MLRHIATTALVLAALTACTTAPAPVATTTPNLPPCPTEDSVGCYWDAYAMGNGTGRSYWVEADSTVHYCSDVTAYDREGVAVRILSHQCW